MEKEVLNFPQKKKVSKPKVIFLALSLCVWAAGVKFVSRVAQHVVPFRHLSADHAPGCCSHSSSCNWSVQPSVKKAIL